MLGRIDGVQLARYCLLTEQWQEMQSVLAQWHGAEAMATALLGENGKTILATLKHSRETHAELCRIEARFGMTPSDRRRIEVDTKSASSVLQGARTREVGGSG